MVVAARCHEGIVVPILFNSKFVELFGSFLLEQLVQLNRVLHLQVDPESELEANILFVEPDLFAGEYSSNRLVNGVKLRLLKLVQIMIEYSKVEQSEENDLGGADNGTVLKFFVRMRIRRHGFHCGVRNDSNRFVVAVLLNINNFSHTFLVGNFD